MRRIIIAIVLLSCLLVVGQDNPYVRQFFSTNNAPVVEAVAGSNCFVTFSSTEPGGQVRSFRIDVPNLGAGTTNIFYVPTNNIYFQNQGKLGGQTQGVYYVTLGITNYFKSLVGGDALGVTLYADNDNILFSNSFPNLWWTNPLGNLHGSISQTNTSPTNEPAFGSISNNYNVGIRGLLSLYGYDTNNILPTQSPYVSRYYSTNPFIEFRVGGANLANTYVGRNAGFSNQSGGFNTFVGYGAGSNNMTADHNTYMGAYAGAVNISSAENVGIGYKSLLVNKGAGNTAVGSQSMFNNTSGDSSVAVGYNALQGQTTGRDNIGVGQNALASAQASWQNVAVGSAAMYAGVGSNNIIMGRQAFYGGQGFDTIGLGQEAFYSSFGRSNVGIGTYVGRNLLFGDQNVMLGSWAGRGLMTGSCNVIIGDGIRIPQDGSYGLTYNGSSNILIGIGGFTKARYDRTNAWQLEDSVATRYSLIATQSVNIGYPTMSPYTNSYWTNAYELSRAFATNIQFRMLVPSNLVVVTISNNVPMTTNVYGTTGDFFCNVPMATDKTMTASNGFIVPIQSGGVSSVPGMGILWNSNSVLYWVTPTATNVVNDGRTQQ